MRSSRGRLAVALGTGLLVVGCMPAPATQEAEAVDRLYRIFLGGGIAIGLLVWGLATFAILRYRRRPHPADRDPATPRPLPRQVAGHLGIEVVWTAIPVAIVLALFGLSVVTLAAIESRRGDPGVELRATGFRWGWTFEYPAGGVTVSSAAVDPSAGTTGGPEIVLPVGVPIHVHLESVDVNHAFYVPRFLFKRDAIPGRPTSFTFVITDPGTYGGVCAEFCGVYHAQMPFTIRAVPPAEFERWLAAGGTP